MKTKKMSKKLNLKKVTVSNLAGKEMDQARGGATGIETFCGVCSLVSCAVTNCFAQCSGPYHCHC